MPHSRKKVRVFSLYKWRLVAFRATVLVMIVLFTAGMVMLALGLTTTVGTKRLENERDALRDSLEKMKDIELQVLEIQRDLEEIRETRIIMENLATIASTANDSL